MPELPEVETVKETLKLKVIGKTITKCEIFHPNMIAYPTNSEFIKRIVGKQFTDIKRRGKWLVFYLDDYVLLSHLRMEGKYFFKNKDLEKLKHEHVIFTLNNKEELRYHDTRKFGRMYLYKEEELDTCKPLADLGYEPWDKNLNSEYLMSKYKTKKLPIKTVLLDQSIITGIGNIYADEILFLSNLNPYTKCNELNKKDCNNIINNTKITLEKAIKQGGTTIRSYTSSEGVSGKFQHELYVHSKENHDCLTCNDKIIKVKIGGRGTYYCPKCQKN